MKKMNIKTAASILTLLGTISLSTVEAGTATSGIYQIDPAHTSVTFTVNHLGISELVGLTA
jgi:polyisoprenoid-binding protein YceI